VKIFPNILDRLIGGILTSCIRCLTNKLCRERSIISSKSRTCHRQQHRHNSTKTTSITTLLFLIAWTDERFQELCWRPIMKHMTGKKSTRQNSIQLRSTRCLLWWAKCSWRIACSLGKSCWTDCTM